ncbi:A-kinase anchor protein 17A [Fasciola gigantica]|uniref:A-kinase anchor protein 17A n=1 Tax=Fasciola gigantica TaxID=46835 RepID=A0A504YSI9_FASGI|nr:A-kinase anchor protein 17A [Fasciola gigantica]
MIGSSVPSELSKTSELFPLSKNYQLYLKPLARVSLTVQIPTLHDASGQTKSFTTWGIIEKLRQLCPGVLSPPTPIKVVRTTLEFVRFIAELETKAEVKRVVTSLDSQFIKLSGFPQNLRVRASEAQTDCPRRHDWESFFRDASNMDETQPGERPDTLVLTGLPVRWFVNPVAKSSSHINGTGSSAENYSSKSDRPCLDVLRSVFETFGPIRNVDIPMLDPVQNPHCVDEFINEICGMKIKTDESHSSTATPTDDRDAPLGFVSQDREIGGFGKICPDTISIMGRPSTSVLAKARKSVIDDALGPIDTVDGDSNSQTPSVGSLTFVAYVQYMDYTGFSRAMEGLRGQKLVYAPTSCERHSAESTDTRLYFTAEIKVDFDRSKHLSRPAIQTRQVERNRLITVANRRLAEAEAEAAQIAKQQRMLEDAKRKENERIRMEALAREAEREARRAARLERKKQRAIERCKQEKDALVRQKITLDERRRLLAVRKLEAIRLVTFLIARIQSRHDEIVSAKREARVARAEREAAEAEARLAQQAAVAISTAAHPRPMVSPKRSSSALNESDLCDPREDETERLRQHLLAKMLRRREEMLRAALLEKHAEAEHVQNFNRRSSNEVSSSTVTKRRRSPVHS